MIYTHAAAAIGGAVIAGALAWNVQGLANRRADETMKCGAGL